MADRLLMVSWGTVVRGREERALDVFNESVGLYGRMQQDGRIESFDVVLLDPHGGLGGYFELHGTAEQVAALRADEEFRRTMFAAQLIVDDLRIVDGHANEGIAREMEHYRESIASVPQAS